MTDDLFSWIIKYALTSGHPEGMTPENPRSYAQQSLQIPPTYPKPRLFNKKLPTPLPGGKDVCSTKSKGAIFQKSSITSVCYTRSGYTVNPLSYNRLIDCIKQSRLYNFVSTYPGWFIYQEEVRSWFWSSVAWPPTLKLGFSTLDSGYLWRTDIILLPKIETPSLK